MSFIGPKEIENSQTSVGSGITEVTYVDGTKETLSDRMYEALVSDESVDLTALREKRIQPVVAEVLGVLRNWGIKISELGYFSAVLNNSLDENSKAAEKILWKPWIPTLQDIDDVDLIAVDRVLKAQKDE